MGYSSNQPYMSNAPTSQGLGRYGDYNGARFANMGVGNSQRYGTQFKPGGRQQTPPGMPQGMGYNGMGPLTLPGFGMPQGRGMPPGQYNPQPQYSPQPQGNALGRPMTNSPGGGNALGVGQPMQDPYGYPPPPSSGGLGRPQTPQAPQAPAQWGPNANPLLASYIGASNYTPQQSNGYSFADQEAQLRQMYGY